MSTRHAATLVLCLMAAVAAAQTLPDIPAPSDVAAPPADALHGASGLVSRVVTPGNGVDRPRDDDYVTVHYAAWTTDGHLVDSSRARYMPNFFPLNRVMAGWRECVGLMTVGETRRCWVPQNLAYNGQAGRPTGTVVFDIELLDTRPSPATAPPDVAAPPVDALTTKSGVRYKVMRAGAGTRHPTPQDGVTVHFSGWTTAGMLFDSTLLKGRPVTLEMTNVIAGWTEGMQLMVEGERTRFWIPQNLAYDQGGGPRGMLVFDIELIKINR